MTLTSSAARMPLWAKCIKNLLERVRFQQESCINGFFFLLLLHHCLLIGVFIPNGFAVTAYAYRYFIEKVGLAPKIKEALTGMFVM
jgi:hypothetical protein